MYENIYFLLDQYSHDLILETMMELRCTNECRLCNHNDYKSKSVRNNLATYDYKT